MGVIEVNEWDGVPEQAKKDMLALEAQVAAETPEAPAPVEEPEMVIPPIPEQVVVPVIEPVAAAAVVEEVVEPEVPEPVVVPDAAALQAENERLQHRVEVTVGMNKKVGSLQKQVAEQEAENATLRAKVKELTPVMTNFQGMSDPDFSKVTGNSLEHIEEYGRGPLEREYNNSERANRSTLDMFEEKFEALEKKLAPVPAPDEVGTDSDAVFFTEIDRRVPNWRTIDKDPKFNEFLRTQDLEKIFSYATNEVMDAELATSIMLRFEKEVPSPSSTTPAQTPIPSQVTPAPAASGGEAPAPKQPKRISYSELKVLEQRLVSGQLDYDPKAKEECDLYINHMIDNGLVDGIPS